MNVYVASPYKLPTGLPDLAQGTIDEFVKWRADVTMRLTASLQYAAWLVKRPIFFYSPIGYETAVAKHIQPENRRDQFRGDGAYWMEVDRSIWHGMDHCVVLDLPGWTRSSGVDEEVAHFRDLIGSQVILFRTLSTYPPGGRAINQINKILGSHERTSKERLFTDIAAMPHQVCDLLWRSK